MNRKFHKDLQEAFQPVAEISSAHLEDTIRKAKEMCRIAPIGGKCSLLHICRQQAHFLGWSTWVIQTVMLLTTILLMCGSFDTTSKFVMSIHLPLILGFAAIIFALPTFLGIDRSARFGMVEIELPTLVSLGRLMVVRAFLVGTGSILGLAALFVFTSVYIRTDSILLLRILSYILLPHFASCFVGLAIIHLCKGRSSTFPCLVSCSLLVCLMACLYYLFPEAYAVSSLLIWYIAIGILLVLCTIEFIILIKKARVLYPIAI